MLLVRNENVEGYREVVGKENGHLRLLSFGVLNLAVGKSYFANTGDEERVLVLLSGSLTVEVDGQTFSATRESVFAEKATAVYLPIQTDYLVRNTGDRPLQAALCGTPSPTQYRPFLVTPDEVWSRTVGENNWQRSVHDIVVKNAEGRVHRIIVGETFNEPGNWSSYPPHKHDNYIPDVEADMEEVYYYQLNPQQGFGIQAIYTQDDSVNDAYQVRNGDSFLIPGGYHPVCAAGGYQLYYLWMMAGDIDRVMIPHDDPTHAWVKG